MSADVARAHGGDAGGDPPPDPTRIPTTCDSGNFFLLFYLHMFIMYILIFYVLLIKKIT